MQWQHLRPQAYRIAATELLKDSGIPYIFLNALVKRRPFDPLRTPLKGDDWFTHDKSIPTVLFPKSSLKIDTY